MSHKKEVPYVLFGAWDYPTKTLQAFRWKGLKGIGVSICEIKNDDHKYNFGDLVPNEDIVGRYFNIWFSKKESLDAFIKGMVELRRMMDEDEPEEEVSP